MKHSQRLMRARVDRLEATEGGEVGLLLLELEEHRHGRIIKSVRKKRNRRY